MSRPAAGVQSAVMTNDCQVLIAGAGPTGLVLACGLLARGIRARIIDKGDGASRESRALGLHARTLEVFDMMGLADQFVSQGQVVRRFHMYTDGRTLVRLELARNGSAFGFMLDVPQDVTETILRRRVSELGGRVEQQAELYGLAADSGGVTATVREPGGVLRTITTDYLVGADGAHSRVRSSLGLEFRGHRYTQDWLLADVHLDWDRPEDEMHAFFRRDGRPLICMPMREHRWRVILPFAGERDRRAPALEEIQRLVGERAPEPVPVSDPSWLATFRCQRRSAQAYKRGRVLLAGDAVHVHSPAGGQGMNTGITDAHNLAWKLALVASGRSPEALLDTYGAERGPVAAEVLALTHALVRLGTVSRPVPRAARNAIIPAAGQLAALQRRAVRRVGQIHVSHASSTLTRPDHGRGGVRPGQRVPDVLVTGDGGTFRLYEVLRRGRHVLVISAGRGVPAALDAWRDEVTVAEAAEILAAPDRVYLIRPDGYVAARGSLDRPGRLLDYLEQLFGGTDRRDPALVIADPG